MSAREVESIHAGTTYSRRVQTLRVSRCAERLSEVVVGMPEDVAPLVHAWLANCDRSKEHFVCIRLDARHRVIGIETVSVGTLNSSIVHPREVFAPAVVSRSAAIILAHNHPSGELDPSDDDLELTARLAKVGDLLGIAVIDHLIVNSSGGHVSLKQRGDM